MAKPGAKSTYLAWFPTIFLSLCFVILVLSLSAREPGCVEAYQFDNEETFVSARPTTDGIFGSVYDDVVGGENASWHKTGVRANGQEMIFEIRGTWTAWDSSTQTLELMDVCRMCAKKDTSSNCICDPNLEIGNPNRASVREDDLTTACTTQSDQSNPSLCTCTTFQGTVNDLGVYHFSTDYQTKAEIREVGDNQNECRYNKGTGLYVGLFGQDGNATPNKVYHMYSNQEICNITRDAQGKCVDDQGIDQAKYVYKSPNGEIFKKTDTPSEYHKAGEYVKFIISDRYYTDNDGGYGVSFIGGFIRGEDVGLMESVVGSVEDFILGKVVPDDENNTIIVDGKNKRVGGAIEYLYNLIVKDSVFILLVQMCLIFYIVIFGIFVLTGSIELTRKEFVKRLVKISLVIFFTTQASWYFYNQIVVGFFKDAMDYVISIFMTMSDNTFDQTSLVISSQLDRAQYAGNSTRFAYIDVIIKKLFSAATSKKILSLVLEPMNVVIMGILYVMAIYALIFGFLFVMLTAAVYYIKILLGLVFVLALGPIFMITVLFDKTDEIFKRWLAYLAAASLQIISLFLILYLFAITLDKEFNDLLYFKACTQVMNYALFTLSPYISEAGRGLVEWIGIFIKIAALLYLLKMIIAKIPGFIGSMVGISFGGKVQKADASPSYFGNTNKSVGSIASNLFGKGKSAMVSVLRNSTPYLDGIGNSAGRNARGLGLTAPTDYLRNKAYNNFGIRGPITMYNDRQIDALIKANRSGSITDQALREKVLAEARAQGISDEMALRRLERKLVVEPLKQAVKDQIEKVKEKMGTNVPLGSEAMADAIRDGIRNWAAADSTRDVDKFMDLLDSGKFQEYIDRKGTLSSKEALELAAKDRMFEMKYLANLKGKKSDELSWGKRKYTNFKEGLSHLKGENSNLGSDVAIRRLLRNLNSQHDYNDSESFGRGIKKAFVQSDAALLIKSGMRGGGLGLSVYEQDRVDKALDYVNRFNAKAPERVDDRNEKIQEIEKTKIDADNEAKKILDDGVKADAFKVAEKAYNEAIQKNLEAQKAELSKAKEMAAIEARSLEQNQKIAEEQAQKSKKAEDLQKALDQKIKAVKSAHLVEYLDIQAQINSIKSGLLGASDAEKAKKSTEIAQLETKATNAKSEYDKL